MSHESSPQITSVRPVVLRQLPSSEWLVVVFMVDQGTEWVIQGFKLGMAQRTKHVGRFQFERPLEKSMGRIDVVAVLKLYNTVLIDEKA